MKRTVTALVILLAACGGAGAEGYDFFGRARYPGPAGNCGADLYKVDQDGGVHAAGYQRRVVHWWPRKGVDIIEVHEGMPLRTWTLREPELDLTLENRWFFMEQLRAQRPSWRPRRFKAHLIGFRGLGVEIGNPYRDNGRPLAPAAVLRLEDGTKRCFTRGSLIDEDERFLIDLYVREMKRIEATLDRTPYVLRGGVESQFPDNAKPGEPGTMRVESDHFSFNSGSQAGGDDDPWANEREPDKARQYREMTVRNAEYYWAFSEYVGRLMPYWDREGQHKYNVTVCGTKRDGHEVIPGYAGGGYGACGIRYASAAGLFHEWGHGHPYGWKLGGGEVLCDAHQGMADPAILNCGHNLLRPWRNCMQGSPGGYKTVLFYSVMGEDPSWGYGWLTALPAGVEEWSVFQTLARVGEQRGLFANGIRGVGDMVGEYGARLAELDCEIQENLRREFIAAKRNRLEAVDRDRGVYRIPWEEAPEAFGVNILRLVPDSGAQEIGVDFRGEHDPDTHGDWRACIVVVGRDGKARYSPLWNKGGMTVQLQPGDRRCWLTVAATPSALLVGQSSGKSANAGVMLYYGRHALRYPYEVTLSGARPGSPHFYPGDCDDYELTYAGDWAGDHLLPHPGDTPQAERLRQALPARIAWIDKQKEARRNVVRRRLPDGEDLDAALGSDSSTQALQKLRKRCEFILANQKGNRHANGGGWVAASARVAPAAYVGPEAMVLDGAQVLDRAVVEDYAVVSGPGAVISGDARICGQAVVKGNVRMGDWARTWHPLDGTGGEVEAEELPARLFADGLSEWKLWANYAMDRQENTTLEDWYRFPYKGNSSWTHFHELNLNGRLHGRPEFAVEGERRGFRFNGRTQYAEASPDLADLAEITVDISLKWEGGSEQVLFDFGTSPDHRLVLKAAGASGRPELLATVRGDTERVAASEALAVDAWARIRVEIDGTKMRLLIDDRQVAAKASSFRPAHAFPPGRAKRNFLAASRDGSGCFRGTLDRVTVYHGVHGDFRDVPEATRDAPRRISAEFVAAVEKAYGNLDDIRQRHRAVLQERMRFFNELKIAAEQRLTALKERSPAFLEAQANLAAVEAKVAQRERKAAAEFDSLPETKEKMKALGELKKELGELKSQGAKVEQELYGEDAELAELEAKRGEAARRLKDIDAEARKHPAYAALDAECQALSAEMRKIPRDDGGRLEQARARESDLRRRLSAKLAEIRNGNPDYARLSADSKELPKLIQDRQKALREELAKENPVLRRHDERNREHSAANAELNRLRADCVRNATVDLALEIGAAEKALKEAADEALEPYAPEQRWLSSLLYQAFRGYYNTPYDGYLSDKIMQELGGGEMREDLAALSSLLASQTPEAWRMRVDWDWRTKWEADGSIANLPLTRKWLHRVRGPIVTERPGGTE